MTLPVVAPEDVGFAPGAIESVDRILEAAVVEHGFPGGVIAVGKDARLAWHRPFGRHSYDPGSPAVTRSTIYDLASLTKVVVTTTAAMLLVDDGVLDLEHPVASVVPEFAGGAKQRVTVSDLLTHASGLPATAPLFRTLRGKPAIVAAVAGLDLTYVPGSQSVYSDPGAILLGEVLERVAGETLDTLAERRILAPLGMLDTSYRPGPERLARIAPTEVDAWRGRLVHGEVHDENAFAMGGVAAHAGLFGTAGDLALFAQMLVDGGAVRGVQVVSRAAVERFTARAGIPGSSRALGWDTPAPGSSAGTRLSARSFGHTGFTGTSVWIDPDRRLFVILLTNRVHPTRERNVMPQVRPAVADAVVGGLTSGPSSGAGSPGSPS